MISNNKSSEYPNLTTKLSNGRTLDREPLYNHLGTILHELGTCKTNIERRISLAVTATNKVMEISSPSKVGNLSTHIRLQLHNIVILTILTYNLEAWASITQDEIKDLEKCQYRILRKLLNLPQSTSYYGILYEIGQWRVEDLIYYKRMMLLHNILHSPPDRIIRRIFIDQEVYPCPNCWLKKRI